MSARRGPRDMGSISILFVAGITAIIMIIGVSVDGGGQIRARQQAADIAAEAARAGGQSIDLGQATLGTARVIDPARAATAINSYLDTVRAITGDDIPGAPTITYANGFTQITVTVTVKYHTRVLTLVGLQTLTVTGTATATLITTVN